MTENEIIEKLSEIFKIVIGKDVDISERSIEDRLVEDLGLTSINILYMVIAVEEMFKITFDNVGMNDFKTVKDVVLYIKNCFN